MDRNTDELWQTLLEKRHTRRETRFDIGEKSYGAQAVIRCSVERQLYETFSFGNAASARLSLELEADSIPRAAEIRRFVRLVNGEEKSSWRPAGVFYTNRRSEEDGVWSIEAFDAMRKAEAVWEPEESVLFPAAMPQAAALLAREMGCELDPRTELNGAYTVDYPPTGVTVRQELQYIAAAHGGNWIVTGEGKLLLLPLGSEPAETHYLITETGRAITLGRGEGKVRILV